MTEQRLTGNIKEDTKLVLRAYKKLTASIKKIVITKKKKRIKSKYPPPWGFLMGWLYSLKAKILN